MIHVYTCPHHGAVASHVDDGWIWAVPTTCPRVNESGVCCGKTLTHCVQVVEAR